MQMSQNGMSTTRFVLIAGWIPYVRNIKKLITLVGMLLLVAGAYFKGGYGVEMEWRAKVDEMKAKVAAAEAKAKEANTHVETKIVTKIVKIQDKANTVRESIRRNKEKINATIDYEKDYTYDYFGFKTLERAYLKRVNGKIVERPQHMLMRVSLAIHKDDIKEALKSYKLMSEGFFTHATPIQSSLYPLSKTGHFGKLANHLTQ